MSTPETTTGKKTLKLEQPPVLGTTNGKISQAAIELEHDAEMLAKAKLIDEQDEAEEKARASAGEKPAVKILGRQKESTELKQFRREEAQALVEWIRTLQGVGAIEIKIARNKPQMFRGKVTKGYLDTISEPITEDELRDRWGGGQYQLKCMRKDERGSWVYFANTMIEVAGDPRLDNLPGMQEGAAAPAAARSSDGDSPFAIKSLEMMERQMDRQVKNAASNGMDMGVIAQFMAPLQTQIAALTAALSAKDDKLVELTSKPSNPHQDKLFEKLIDGDSARVNAIRTQFESEIRQLKDNFREDEKRLVDRYERERERADRDFQRQIDTQKQMYERELSNVKSLQVQLDTAKDTSLTVTKAQLESDNRRLERDLASAAADLKELRAKKDQSITEKLKEVGELKKLLGVEEGEAEVKGTFEKVVDTVMGSEQLFDFVGKWVGPKGAAPAAAPPAQLPAPRVRPSRPRVIKDKRNGQVSVLAPNGQYVPVRQNPVTNEIEQGVQIPPAQLEMAVRVMESSFANKTKPDNFARTISTALPPEIFAAIRDLGVDGFIQKVAKLSAASPLRTQAGINWLRAVGVTLLGDEPAPVDAPVDDELPDLDDAPTE